MLELVCIILILHEGIDLRLVLFVHRHLTVRMTLPQQSVFRIPYFVFHISYSKLKLKQNPIVQFQHCSFRIPHSRFQSRLFLLYSKKHSVFLKVMDYALWWQIGTEGRPSLCDAVRRYEPNFRSFTSEQHIEMVASFVREIIHQLWEIVPPFGTS